MTNAFRGSSAHVKVCVASRVVHAGFMLKKGELNSQLQLRWFMLHDEADGSVLRYFDGRNAMSRKLKGEIKISPEEVSSVRSATHEAGNDKLLGVSIFTPSRQWELICNTPDEARTWLQLLTQRSRKADPMGNPGRSSTAAGGRSSLLEPMRDASAAAEGANTRTRAKSTAEGATTRL